MCFIAKWIVCHHNNPEVLGSSRTQSISLVLECQEKIILLQKRNSPAGECVKPSHKMGIRSNPCNDGHCRYAGAKSQYFLLGSPPHHPPLNLISLFNVIRPTTHCNAMHWADNGCQRAAPLRFEP